MTGSALTADTSQILVLTAHLEHFQWYMDGLPISGANHHTLVENAAMYWARFTQSR